MKFGKQKKPPCKARKQIKEELEQARLEMEAAQRKVDLSQNVRIAIWQNSRV